MTEHVRTLSGKEVSQLDLDGVVSGDLGPDDFRISPETLISQAEKSEAEGYTQLGLNLRRAAELTGLESKFIFDIYEMLRPGRAGKEELLALADSLEKSHGAPLNAELLREAARHYARRGLLKAE